MFSSRPQPLPLAGDSPDTPTKVSSSTPAVNPRSPNLSPGPRPIVPSIPFSPFVTYAPRFSSGTFASPSSSNSLSSSLPLTTTPSMASTISPGLVPMLPPSTIIPSAPSARVKTFQSTAATMETSTIIPGLCGSYNPSLVFRAEWVRLGPVLSALSSVKEARPGNLVSDFVFRFAYQSRSMQTFDSLHQSKLITISVLLLSPDRFTAINRRDTGSAIRSFVEDHKVSIGVIVYLMDAQASEGQQVEALHSLGDLHNFLSLGVSEPLPVIVVPEASYLISCVEGFMKSMSLVNPKPAQTIERASIRPTGIPATVKIEKDNPFLRTQN